MVVTDERKEDVATFSQKSANRNSGLSLFRHQKSGEYFTGDIAPFFLRTSGIFLLR